MYMKTYDLDSRLDSNNEIININKWLEKYLAVLIMVTTGRLFQLAAE